MKKRNMMLGSAILLAVLLVAGGTMAWFTAEADPVINKFTAGTVAIELHDKTIKDGETIDFPEAGFTNVNPGDEYDKIVNVENVGSKRAYVRVQLTPFFSGELGTDVVTYPILENWVLHTDGWYYYKSILQPEDITTNLIEEVLFAGAAMNNDYQGAEFTLTVKAEAVQATHEAYKDAWSLTALPAGVEVLSE